VWEYIIVAVGYYCTILSPVNHNQLETVDKKNHVTEGRLKVNGHSLVVLSEARDTVRHNSDY